MDDLIEMFCENCGTVTVHQDGENDIVCTSCVVDTEVEEEYVSLDEMRDEELAGSDYVEGIDNWEDWN